MTMQAFKRYAQAAVDKKLDLVGVHVTNSFLDEAINVKPYITMVDTVDVHNNSATEVVVSFDPEYEQYSGLDNLVSALERPGVLVKHTPGDIAPKPAVDDAAIEALKELNGDFNNYDIGFIFPNDTKVEHQVFTIHHTKFYQVEITGKFGILDIPVTVACLYKKHTSDSRTFFSDLVSSKETPTYLTPGDLRKIADFTGQHLVGAHVSYVELKRYGTTFAIINSVGPIQFELDGSDSTKGNPMVRYKASFLEMKGKINHIRMYKTSYKAYVLEFVTSMGNLRITYSA